VSGCRPEHTSRPVASDQSAPHPRLPGLIRRYRANPHRRPQDDRFTRLFAELDRLIADQGLRVVLDSGCGTGLSSRALAQRFPKCLVIACDRSAARLRKASGGISRPDNLRIIRADLPALWAHARTTGWPVLHHFLLYPNPWPKPRHLTRRWHANPAMADLLALGGTFEMRTNWALYADESAQAIGCWTGLKVSAELFRPELPLSAFERKYQRSGHALFRVRATLGSLPPTRSITQVTSSNREPSASARSRPD
jgi:tRNA (guanine-N7-)-methyltransferase